MDEPLVEVGRYVIDFVALHPKIFESSLVLGK